MHRRIRRDHLVLDRLRLQRPARALVQ
jgi:hypothetical protein